MDNPFWYGPFDPLIYSGTSLGVATKTTTINVPLHDPEHFKEETAHLLNWKPDSEYPYDFKDKDYDIVFAFVNSTDIA